MEIQLMPSKMKICSLCKQEKTIIEFSIRGHNPDRYSSACKTCNGTKAREKYKKLHPIPYKRPIIKTIDPKSCNQCKEIKPLEEFFIKRHIDGLPRYSGYCKKCTYQKQKERNQANNPYKIIKPKQTKEERKIANRSAIQKRHNEWISFFKLEYGQNPECAICRKPLIYKSGKKDNTVIFDHRHEGNEPIKINPSNFWQSRPLNDVNVQIWKECDFGILCIACNKFLPTLHRKIWLRKITEYIDGDII